ncbi:MAG: hypothetical protein KTR16_01660 [Acidiferrobacterales bacterium]|nr:hypothetical protein [Acidiferrobacterales bacterium]
MTASVDQNSTTEKARLEDLMVAMDVVDTLRHSQQLVDRELDAESRRERLIAKLRDIYASQGLAVTDEMLEEGVKALEEERFQYSPPKEGFSHKLARVYIARSKWLKPFIFIFTLLVLLAVFCWFVLIQPERKAIQQLPQQLSQAVENVKGITDDSAALQLANELKALATQAIKDEDYKAAERNIGQLRLLQTEISQSYTIRVVQNPGESSGVWRIPDVNQQARNYYLIVEAVNSFGKVIYLPITNEETGRVKSVNKWGVRVGSDLFNRIASDKSDDGIIQNREIGKKVAGEYKPHYLVQVQDGMITEW